MTNKHRVDRNRNPYPSTTGATRFSRAAWKAVLVAGLGLAGAVEAADAPTVPPSVTLADALRQALRPDNPALELQSDNVAGAAGRLQATKGAFDWRSEASAGWQQYYIGRTSPNGVVTNQTQIVSGYSYTVDVAKQFRNGVEIAPGVTQYPTPQYGSGSQTLPRLGLKIPFLRGSGSSVDAPERAAQAALQAARSNRAFAEQQLAQQVAAAFWGCIADAQFHNDAEEIRNHADSYLNSLQKQVDKGLLDPDSVQQFKLSHLSDKLSVERAQDEETRCRRNLGLLLTGTVDQVGPAPVGELPDVAVVGPAVDKLRDQDLIQLALDRRQDLEAAARNLSAAHENVVGAKTYLLPQLDVRVDPQQAFVTFVRPFGNNYGKGKNAEARAQENAAIATLRNLQDQVRTQVSDSLAALRRARSDWTTLAGAEAQMASIVSDTEKRARLGTTSWADYMNVQNQLTQLHQQETNARLAFAVNLSLLELAIGAIDPDRPTELAQNLAQVPAS